MRPGVKVGFAIALGCTALVLAPAIAQRSPQSILPPGFGDPPPSAETPPPADAPANSTASAQPPGPDSDPLEGMVSDETGNGLDNAMIAAPPPEDLPPQARRSLEQVGLLSSEDGGLGADAFGDADGRFLATLMGRMKAPVASRWASILLRRALLSQSNTPVNLSGADWVAHRTWLLVRMGEADNARALVSRVDAENFTPWLNEAAMQAALASADPAVLCGIADAASAQSDRASWTLAQAMCAGLSGEGGTASSLVSQARNTRRAGGIDVLLAEKVVGAGTNTRRAITIQWDGVETLTAWRFGLAAATGVAIPSLLYATAGPQVRAWAARAPLTEPGARAGFADRAATLGVFSSAALVDLYGSIYDAADPADRSGTVAANLRAAYVGEASARLSALQALLAPSGNAFQDYARAILTARAAAMILPDTNAKANDVDAVVGAMFSAGLDVQAARWANAAKAGSRGWAMIALGAPRPVLAAEASAIEAFEGQSPLTRQYLFAGMAALGRIPQDEIASLSTSLAVPVARSSSWTRALDRAVLLRQRGTVALLCAAGMQTTSWRAVPPAHLFHIVASLRKVGMEPEARMIAVEALTRS